MRRACLLSVLVVVAVAAPAGAGSYVTFQTPSKKIGCAYTRATGEDANLRCDLVDVDHPAKRPASCELDYGHAFGLGAHGRATRLCVGDTALDTKAKVLAYGKRRTLGPFTCVSRTSGLRCTTRAGHGFELSRQRQRLF